MMMTNKPEYICIELALAKVRRKNVPSSLEMFHVTRPACVPIIIAGDGLIPGLWRRP
jgi:hypothetical protein